MYNMMIDAELYNTFSGLKQYQIGPPFLSLVRATQARFVGGNIAMALVLLLLCIQVCIFNTAI